MKEPIFIVGVGRSGTSLLTSMLNSHPNISIQGETWYIPLLHQYLANVNTIPKKEEIIAIIEKRGTVSNLGLTKQELINQLEETNFANKIDIIAFAHLARMKKEKKVRWGDKTPGYLSKLALIHELFPKAYIIHLIRDGRDVSLSMLAAIRKGYLKSEDDTLIKLAHHWKNNIVRGRKEGIHLFKARYYEVKYEDLLTNPEVELTSICKLIEEDFNSKMLNYTESALKIFHPNERLHHSKLLTGIDINNQRKWKNGMALWQQILFCKISGNLLDQLGYEKTSGKSTKAFLNILFHNVNRSLKFLSIYSKKIKNRLSKVLNKSSLFIQIEKVLIVIFLYKYA